MASSNKIGWNWTDSVTEQLRARKNSNAVRWYVLALPTSRKGHYQGNPVRALQMELERRARSGDPVFEYFAPSYVEVRKQHGELVRTNHPLLYLLRRLLLYERSKQYRTKGRAVRRLCASRRGCRLFVRVYVLLGFVYACVCRLPALLFTRLKRHVTERI